jgi:galactose mutarotase-like enzyme
MNEIVELATSAIAIKIDLTRGGTITHIGKSLDEDSNVLAWYEFDDIEELPIQYPHGESEHYWMSRYRGGWQLLTPSADTECDVGGRHHSFHGDSSILPWRLVSKTSNEIAHEVTIFDALHVNRVAHLESDRPALTVTTTITNIGEKVEPFIKVEHIAYRGSDNGEVTGPDETVWKFHDYVYEGYSGEFKWKDMDSHGVNIRNRNMNEEGRLVYILRDSEGWVEWNNPDFGQRTRASWDPQEFPHLWYWQENGADMFPFNGRSRITALEPASVPPGTRLIGAVEQDRASYLQPGESHTFSIQIELK